MVRTRQEPSTTSAFAKTVETVFRKLIRFLVGRVSLANLQEMIRHIYVEEAERALGDDHPGKKVTLAKLALVTGLDTRTVSMIRDHVLRHRNRYTQLPLKELTPESAVVEAWAEEVGKAADAESARVKSYDGPESAFEQLFRATIKSRGVTPQSVIERLVSTKSVEVDARLRTLKLVVSEFSPYVQGEEPDLVISALSALSNLVSTIENNFGAEAADRFFQRQSWTYRLSRSDIPAFRATMRALLSDSDTKAREKMAPFEESEYTSGQVTAGAGFYYFEEEGDQA